MILLLLFLSIAIYIACIAPRKLKINSFSLNLKESNPGVSIKIACFSDIHLGRFKTKKWAKKVAEKVNAEHPDFIFILGDFVHKANPHKLGELLSPFSKLKSTYGAYAVLGNHDYGIVGDKERGDARSTFLKKFYKTKKNPENPLQLIGEKDLSKEIKTILEKEKIHVLENENVQILDQLFLIGIGDYASRKENIQKAFHCVPEKAAKIVISHSPDILLSKPKNDAADIWLFGHTHGGQIRFSFFGALIQGIKSHYLHGLYKTPFGTVIVTQGTGESTLPLRLLTHPEIVVLNIKI